MEKELEQFDIEALEPVELAEFVSKPEGVDYYLSYFFPEIYDLFKNSGYIPQTMDDANYYLMNEIFEINKLDNILGVYKQNGEEHSVEITKSNFYLGYYQNIWENLTLQEKAQIFIWHFEYKQDELNTKIKLRFMVTSEDAHYHDLDGMSYSRDSETRDIYINPILLLFLCPNELIITLEHECEHVKQGQLPYYLWQRHILPKNEYEIAQYYSMLHLNLKNLKDYANFALYVCDVSELSAETRAVKNYLKYFKQIKKDIGVISKKQHQIMRKVIRDYRFKNFLLPVEKAPEDYFVSAKHKKEYEKSYFIVQNREYLNKLNLINKYYIEFNDKAKSKEAMQRIVQFFKTHEKDEDFVNKHWELIINDEEENEM